MVQTQVDTGNDLLTVGEVARLLRVGQSTVRSWVTRREIPFITLPGGEYRIPSAELFRSLRSNVDAQQVLGALTERLRQTEDTDLDDEIQAVRRERTRRRE